MKGERVTVNDRNGRDVHWNVALLALCYCLGMGSLFSSVAVVALVMRDRVGAGLALLPMALQKLFQTVATYPGARHRTKSGYCAASLLGGTGYAIAALGVALIDEPTSSAAVICAGYCVSGLSDPFTQFLRFTAADISPPAFKARAISYVVAGGALAAVVGPEVSNALVDVFPGRKFAGSYVGASALLLLQGVVVCFVDFLPADGGGARADCGEGEEAGAGADQGDRPLPLEALSKSLEGGGGGAGVEAAGRQMQSTPQPARTLRQIVGQPQFRVLASTAAVLQLTMICLMQICPLVMTEERDGRQMFELWHAVRVIQGHILGM